MSVSELPVWVSERLNCFLELFQKDWRHELTYLEKQYDFHEIIQLFPILRRLFQKLDWRIRKLATYSNQKNNLLWFKLNYANMKRTTIFLAFLLCSFFGSIGQNIDSLVKIIPELDGIEAVDALNKVTKWYACRSKEQAIKYHLLAKKQLDKIEYPNGEITFLTIKGNMTLCSGYADSALVLFEEALQLAKKTETKGAEASINANMGSVYGYKRDLDKALLAFQESKRIGIEIGNIKLQIGCTYNMAHVQERRLKLDSAWMLYQETEELGKKHDRVEYILKGKVGLLGLKVSNNYKSIEPEDFVIALGLAESEKNPRAIYSISKYACTYYKKSEQLDSALFYLEKCKEANEILQDKEGSMDIAADLGSIYALKRNYNEALKFVT